MNRGRISAGWKTADGSRLHEGAVVDIKNYSFTNSGDIASSGTVTLFTNGAFENTRTAKIQSGGAMTVAASSFKNEGKLHATGDLSAIGSLLIKAGKFFLAVP